MNTEFDFPLCEFNRNNPTFLEILRKNVMIYDKDIFEDIHKLKEKILLYYQGINDF